MKKLWVDWSTLRRALRRPHQAKAQRAHDKALTENKGHRTADMRNAAIKDSTTTSHILADALQANPPPPVASSSKVHPGTYQDPPLPAASSSKVPSEPAAAATEPQDSGPHIRPLGRALGEVPPLPTDDRPESFQAWADEMDYVLPFDEDDNQADEAQLRAVINDIASQLDVSVRQASAETRKDSFARVDPEEGDAVGEEADDDSQANEDIWVDDPVVAEGQDAPSQKSDAQELEILSLPLDTLRVALMRFIIQPVLEEREREKNKVGLLSLNPRTVLIISRRAMTANGTAL